MDPVLFMMKVYYPPYLSFRCSAQDCPRNCCSVFRIPFFKWEEEQFTRKPSWRDFNGTLRCIAESLVRDDEGWKCPRSSDGACSFWGEDRLCTLQKKYGEEILPSVCRTYPRIITVYDDRIEYALDPCCPEVLKGLKDWNIGEFICEGGVLRDEGRFLKRRKILEMLSDMSKPISDSGIQNHPRPLTVTQDSFIRKVAALMFFAILFPHEGHPKTPDVCSFILDALRTYLNEKDLPDDWDSLSESFSSFLTDYEISLRCDDEIEGRYRDVNEKL